MRRINVPAEFFSDRASGDKLSLPDEQAHYIRDVLRLEAGEVVELFDGQGGIGRARLLSTEDEVCLEITDRFQSKRGESPLHTVLFQAIPKGKRWKWILEKATELGVDAIVPLETKRTVVQIPDARLSRRMDRWEKIVSSAARQCERSVVPSVSAPISLEKAGAESNCDVELVAHPGGDAQTPQQILGGAQDAIQSVGIWIGPEGGFTDNEVEAMVAGGMHRLGLGPRILRADTAGITALTLTQAALGDLGQ